MTTRQLQKFSVLVFVISLALTLGLIHGESSSILAKELPRESQQNPQSNFLEPSPTPPLDLKWDLEHQSPKASGLVPPPPNDDFDSAFLIPRIPFRHTLDISGATESSDDPDMGAGMGENSKTVWYRFTASGNGRVWAYTFGSSYDTVLAAFASSRRELTLIASDDDTQSLQSEIKFPVQAGTTYYLEVADYGRPGGGQLQLTVYFIPAAAIDVPLDIVLLQDETGSFNDDISTLRRLAPQVWDSIANISRAGFRMSVVGFRDFARGDWGDFGDWVYRLIGDFTTSRSEFVTAVNSLTADGGDDNPESQYAALYYLLTPAHSCIDSNGDGDCSDPWDTPAGQQPSFRSGARRIILLATDAPFHDPGDTPGYPGPTRDTVVAALRASRTIVIGLVPGGTGRLSEVDDLAFVTGGSTQSTGSSGQDVADAIVAALGQIRPVSPDLSTLEVSPASVPADGSTAMTVTVTLRDTANNPVVGKTVLLYSDRGGIDLITQSSAPTDANGRTMGSIRSTTPGTATISAIDVTDNVRIAQRASVQFTGETIPPGEELRRSIDRLDQLSRQQLGVLASVAQGAGSQGDYFRGAIGADQVKLALDALLGFTSIAKTVNETARLRAGLQLTLPGIGDAGWGSILNLKEHYSNAGQLFNLNWRQAIQTGNYAGLTRPVLEGGAKYYAARFRNQLVEEISKDAVVEAWRAIAGSSTGLSGVANQFASDVLDLQNELASQHDMVVRGIPPMSDTEQSAYAAELKKRIVVPFVLSSASFNHGLLLENLRAAHDSIGRGWLSFVLKFIASGLAGATFDGPGKLLVDGLTTSLELYLDEQKLDIAQRAYELAPGVLKGSAEAAARIYTNETSGFDRVARRLPPRPITGQIGNIRHYSQGIDRLIYWEDHISYSDIDITNTSDETAAFEVIVQYGYDSRLFGLPFVYQPIVKDESLVLGPGQTKTVRIYYKQEERGGSPQTGDTIRLDVLASNDGGTFYVAHRDEIWNPQRVSLSGSALAANTVAADTPSIENPIDMYIISDPEDQTYEAQIWIANPFSDTVTATVTQTLPPGVTVVSTDGLVSGSTITWQKTIAASDIASVSFTFRYPSAPGAPLSLPPATMGFVEPTSRQALTIQSNAPNFRGLRPVAVEGNAPVGTLGVQSPMPITVRNLQTESVSGAITVVISDATGAQLYNETQNFEVAQESSQVLTFTLPGNLPVGLYPLEVRLNFNDVTEPVLADVYVVRSPGGTVSNDSCSDATEITTVPFSQTRDTTMATSEPDDPLQSCTYGAPFRNSNSVWYKFTPPQNGTVTAETTGSNYDTVLSAYTGTCGALTEVACNDDTAGTLQSRIAFDVMAGTTHLIEVTQFGNPKGGTLIFSLNFVAATLNVSPNSLTFNGVVGQGNPPPQTITVRNTGGGSFGFSISSSDAGLVSASPSSGTLSAGQSTTVSVSVANPNVAGTRTPTLTITAPGAQGSPQQVSVTVNIAPPPTLDVSPTSLTFNAVAGQGNPPSQTITVRNTGGGSFSFNITSSNPSLVSVSPTSDTLSAGQSRTVQVLVTNPNVAGTQTATLTITAPGALNSPQQVSVTVNIAPPPPALSVSPASLRFDTVVGQGNPMPQTITVRNTGGSSLSFTISSNSSLVSTLPNSGTLSGGQSTPVQVLVTNPNVAGTQTATLTITAPGAQNSPQFVSITIVTTACPQVETEPNDSPQQANPICTPEQGQSVSITGNATPNDNATVVNQLSDECSITQGIHDWFRFDVTQRGAFQVSLNFSGANINYDLWWLRETSDVANFPLGVQLFARSTQSVGLPEVISTRVLEPGTYYIGVMRVRRNDASDAQRPSYTLTLTRGLSPEIHAVEDATCAAAPGEESGVNGVFVVNRVRPTRYPARLESISALFFHHSGRPSPDGRLVRVIAFTDLSGSGTPPPNRPLVVDRTITINIPGPNQGQFNTLILGAGGPVISSGDFYVGYVVNTSRGIFPDAGRALFPNVRSFISGDGGRTYRIYDLRETGTGQPFNVAIRASVNTNPAGSSSPAIQGSQEEFAIDKILLDRPRRRLDELFE